MRKLKSRVSAAALVIVGTVTLATPASAAPNGPDERASCIGRTFVPQATDEAQAIADRIAFIKTDFLAEDESFGNVIGGWFAHSDDC